MISLNVGDTVEVVGDRYNKQFIWDTGKVLNVDRDGWISVKIDHKLLYFRAEEDLFPSWQALKGAAALLEQTQRQPLPKKQALETKKPSKKYSRQIDWSKVPDDVLLRAATEAKRDLGM